MIEEPYRWLEAIANRREYVSEQLKGGSPVFAASLADGILLLGVGIGNSKVFELFDRHGLAGLGHPADLEKIRQAAIDTAHMEAFNRAPDDVSLRRLVAYGLSPSLKTNFEQIFSAPFLVELLLAELGPAREADQLLRLHYDGSFQVHAKPVAVAAGDPETEAAARRWLLERLKGSEEREEVVDVLLQAWWCMTESKPLDASAPGEPERREGWRKSVSEKVIELGWLNRHTSRAARYEALSMKQVGL